MRDYKIVVLGAGGVGKSSLTVQFVQSIYIDTYDPTIEDSYRKQIEVDGRACDLEILDTAGVAQFTAMRELYMKSGKGFLLVYSVTDESSLRELLALREQVLRIKDSTNVPMVLIGNKCDLNDERVLKPEDGIEVSERWGRVPFYETSAMHRTNVDEAFIDVVRQIMRNEALEHQQKLNESQDIQNGSSSTVLPSQRSNTISSQSMAQMNDNSTKSSNQLDTPTTINQTTPNNMPQQQRQQIQSKPLGKVGKSNAKNGAVNQKKKKKKSSCVVL